MDVFAVIPARGGSSRVPKKNVRDVGGKPLIAHAIEQAGSSETVERCIVSTDDDDIAAVAEEHGGDVPFRRPAELATDEATSPPVVIHALDWLEDQGEAASIVVMLQVTSPFRTAADIDGVVGRLREHERATSVVSVSEFDTPPQWALEMDPGGRLSAHGDPNLFWTDDIPRSQDLESLYHPNGAVFAADVPTFRRERSFYTEHTIGYEMSRERSLDIDEPFDLELARAMFELRSG